MSIAHVTLSVNPIQAAATAEPRMVEDADGILYYSTPETVRRLEAEMRQQEHMADAMRDEEPMGYAERYGQF